MIKTEDDAYYYYSSKKNGNGETYGPEKVCYSHYFFIVREFRK